jgi:hypothetical protein
MDADTRSSSVAIFSTSTIIIRPSSPGLLKLSRPFEALSTFRSSPDLLRLSRPFEVTPLTPFFFSSFLFTLREFPSIEE